MGCQQWLILMSTAGISCESGRFEGQGHGHNTRIDKFGIYQNNSCGIGDEFQDGGHLMTVFDQMRRIKDVGCATTIGKSTFFGYFHDAQQTRTTDQCLDILNIRFFRTLFIVIFFRYISIFLWTPFGRPS